ncbi:hypothetical protein BBJ28_00000585, partial [Nothophytophthora sp. Chile5]
ASCWHQSSHSRIANESEQEAAAGTMATVKKLDVHTATSDYSKTYAFHEEDHTLGNALRYVLMRKYVPVCIRCAVCLSVEEARWNCETDGGVWSGAPSDEALRSGLTDLRKVSSQINDAYRKELKAFNRKARKN